ncbi:hypothetical protein Tco_1397771, partial [Tanacetum coccineum]
EEEEEEWGLGLLYNLTTLSGSLYATEELPSSSCGTQNAQLYLDVFQKYSQFCTGSTRRQCTTTFEGRTSYVKINPTNFGKQKWKTKNVDNVFQAYSGLYAQNVRPRCLVDLPHTTSDAEFCSKETTHSQVFGNYADLCATNPNHTGASVLDQRKRTRQSSQVRPPTDEAVLVTVQ